MSLSECHSELSCRPNCGACCIAPSISSPLPGMPEGKPAGVPCVHLLPDRRCALFNDSRRPKVCADFQPAHYVCGDDTLQALQLIAELERLT